MRIHAIQTGTVAVKQRQVRGAGQGIAGDTSCSQPLMLEQAVDGGTGTFLDEPLSSSARSLGQKA